MTRAGGERKNLQGGGEKADLAFCWPYSTRKDCSPVSCIECPAPLTLASLLCAHLAHRDVTRVHEEWFSNFDAVRASVGLQDSAIQDPSTSQVHDEHQDKNPCSAVCCCVNLAPATTDNVAAERSSTACVYVHVGKHAR